MSNRRLRERKSLSFGWGRLASLRGRRSFAALGSSCCLLTGVNCLSLVLEFLKLAAVATAADAANHAEEDEHGGHHDEDEHHS